MARPRADGDSPKRLRRRDMLGGVALLGGSLHAAGPAGAQTVKIRLGTATPGGGFPVYGDAFAQVLAGFL